MSSLLVATDRPALDAGDPDALLDLAARLACTAAHAILAVRAAGFVIERKGDASPVTEADRAAEAIIVEGLRAATPGVPVVAEEEVAAGRAVRLGARYWLVDPLDGTREFAAGRDEFAVCVGLVEGDAPLLGAVAVPATGELFGGIVGSAGRGAGGGAWKADGLDARPSARRAIRACAEPPSGARVVFSRHRADDPALAPFLAGRRVAGVAHYGSALKFLRLAEGAADLYPRFGPTMEWDTAAPQAVLEAAGGSVRVLSDGSRLAYGKLPGLENPPFMARGLG